MASITHQPKEDPHAAHVEAGPENENGISNLKAGMMGQAATDE